MAVQLGPFSQEKPAGQQPPFKLGAHVWKPAKHAPRVPKPADAAVVWMLVKMIFEPPVLPPMGTAIVTPFDRKVEVEVAKRQFVIAHERSTMQQPGR